MPRRSDLRARKAQKDVISAVALALCLSTPVASAAMAQTTASPAAQAAELTADQRAEATLKQMTLAERLTLIRGRSPFIVRSQLAKDVPMGAGYVFGVPRLEVPALVESDASLGIANMNALLRPGDVATALPSAAAMAATWNPDLIERGGAMIGAEARAKGFNVLLAGGSNLVREPRNGRNFEYLGEDPLLAGVLVGHAIRGVQSNNVISTIKHFALNSQETGRHVLSAEMPEGALRESDLLAFEIGIEIGQPGSVMCAYNKLNGVYACESPFLLNDVLRRDWGYKGFVMSDWGAVHSVSLRQGLDQESGVATGGHFGARLDEAMAAGTVTEADVDKAALRILRTIYALEIDKHPLKPTPIDYEAHARIAQAVAENGVVLLKNNRKLLPIASSARRILLVGGHADIGLLTGGGGSSQVTPVGGAVLREPGSFGKKLYNNDSPLLAMREALPNATITYDDGSDPVRAAQAARAADLVIVFAEQYTSETLDVPNLSLPDNQDGLITAVADANPKTVVVLQTGGPVVMPWLNKVGAVLEGWYLGQRGGHAITRVLTGEVNPSGHLPITFPASVEQSPNPALPGALLVSDKVQGDLYEAPKDLKTFTVTYPEGSDVGYRWYDRTKAKPLFAFGHGLSYTKFRYANLRVTGDQDLNVAFKITNVGSRAGADVAQVYTRVNGVKRLVGWSRVELQPGETREVSVTADPRLLASFDVAEHNWHIKPDAYAIEVSAAADKPILTAKAQLSERRVKP